MSSTSTHSFQVFTASAGSGKTFALVKNYLLKVIGGKHIDTYKSLLAITFTNKAVAEMKTRILAQLEHYSKHQSGDKLEQMQYEICEALNMSPEALASRSSTILNDILHNYGSFSVETIDSFNHRILRTFARDLGLRSDFEVTTEADLLLQQAVDQVLAKTGTDEFLTKTLIDFALQKTEEDRSWDPTHQLLEKSKILLQEQSLEPLSRLQEKTEDDFKALTKLLLTEKAQAEKTLKEQAQAALDVISDHKLEVAHFNRGTYPKFMQKLVKGESTTWTGKWQEDIESYAFYTKTQEQWVKDAIDSISPRLIDCFKKAKGAFQSADWYTRLYREVVPMTVLNYIQKEYNEIKEEQNLVSVAEFNRRIYQEIKEQPVPFIYERMGEKYRHFFIDEFQDTSKMQWENLLPLVDNALAQQDKDEQQGSLLLVGDAKQSIYRWRGGKPEQFIGLSSGEGPFNTPPEPVRLSKNWRSYSEIINFNNNLFAYLGEFLEEGDYRDIYTKESRQELNDNLGGYLTLEFFEGKTKADREPVYIDLVKQRIASCLKQGYNLKDICVLTRRKEDSKTLAQALQQDYAVVSPDSLLIKESRVVQLMLAGLQLGQQLHDRETRLNFIWQYCEVRDLKENTHSMFAKASGEQIEGFFEVLEELQVSFSVDRFNSYGLYEALEYLIRCFHLQDHITAFGRHFLDLARGFEQQNNATKKAFLEDWQKQEEAASLQFPESMDAIRLMTVHKAKGLEFPVVIVPFTDSELINIRNEKLWFKVDPDQYCGFSEFYLPLSSIKNQSPETYDTHLRQRFFDELNVWYVALTRAEEELHIMSSTDKASQRNFGGLLRSYLESQSGYDDSKSQYEYGTAMHKTKQEQSELEATSGFISTDKADNKINLIASPRDKYQRDTRLAQERGNRLHLWLSMINTADELPDLFQKLEVLARYSPEQLKADEQLLEQVVNHPELEAYFALGVDARNEAALMDQTGELHRPDRLVFTNDEVVIIDYKFGGKDSTYMEQLDRYQQVLKTIGYTKFKKILVYVQDKIELQTW